VRRLRVFYITVAFPKGSEAFACAEVAALRRAEVDVEVHALLPTSRREAERLRDHDLAGLTTSGGDLRAIARGLRIAVARPRLALEVLGFALRSTWRAPGQLAVSLAWIPRTLDLFARVERERPAVVHLYWGHYPALLGRLVQRHCPDVVVSGSLAAYDLVMHYGASAPVLAEAAFVRSVAEANRGAIEALGIAGGRVLLVRRGIDLRHAAGPSPEKTPDRIAVASRLIASKAIDDVLQTFARIREQRPQASLVVLGDGPERARLEKCARELGVADAVEWRGHVSHKDVFDELLRSELFLLLSRHPSERLPNVVKEAMLCRCACVVSRTPGVDELIEHAHTGFVVAPGDIDAAAAVALACLERGPERSAMLDAAQEWVREHFDIDRSAAMLIEGWRAALPAAGATA
jgi:glycosyltransferase involved in cell wall biosynthesis